MDIQLKHIKFFKQLSRETLCFEANVYVNGKKLGQALNTGDGGETRFDLQDPFNKSHKQLYQEADDHCKQMPDRIIKVPAQFKVPGNEIKAKMDFIEYIDMLVDEEWNRKEKERVLTWITRNQVDSIIFGEEDGEVYRLKLGDHKYKYTIGQLLAHKEMGIEALANTIQEVKKKLKPGQRILNTNIPAELL